jgi:phospholipase/carboxylesterase
MLDAHEIETGPAPTRSLIVLHGLGADGFDFVPIVGELSLDALGSMRFVFPHAPARPVALNGGYVMPAWFDILAPYPAPGEDEAGLRASQAAIAALIDRERARGVPAERIVLMGFSQGCAMALMTALRYPERLAGAVGLSGYLPLAAMTAAERSAANQGLPVFMAHGREDSVVIPARGRSSRDALLALGHPVEWHEYAMPHSVCAEEIADLNAWLLTRLA